MDSEKYWREKLSSEEYSILQEKGTEQPFSGAYNNCFDKGVYVCAGCDSELFSSQSKFASNCGWPSFDKANDASVQELEDFSHGMVRVEVLCSCCGGHLGHVFTDGPTETGLRYCINSLSLKLKRE